MATRIPPPLIMLLVALLMWVVARSLPVGVFDFPGRTALAVLLAAAGVALAVVAVVSFRRAATTVNPVYPERASALVQEGIYRYSRNPMYLGDLLLLFAWGVYFGHVPALFLAGLFVVWLNAYQIPAEEAALERRFGAAYRAYRERVPRWL